MQRLLRYLRFAWTVFGIVACLLVIAQWIRSYSMFDSIAGPLTSTTAINWQSIEGAMGVSLISDPMFMVGAEREAWQHHTTSAEKLRRKLHQSNKPVADGVLKRIFRNFAVARDGVAIPYWFVALSLFAATAAPWFGWSRRFSLRILFAVMTMIASVLGMLIYLRGR